MGRKGKAKAKRAKAKHCLTYQIIKSCRWQVGWGRKNAEKKGSGVAGKE